VFFWEINGDTQPDRTNPLQDAARKQWADGARSAK
jgi:hypothetical protein